MSDSSMAVASGCMTRRVVRDHNGRARGKVHTFASGGTSLCGMVGSFTACWPECRRHIPWKTDAAIWSDDISGVDVCKSCEAIARSHD